MNIVGFDLECANTYMPSAICWAGVVRFDENFNLIQEKDIKINPLCKSFKVGDSIEFPFTIEELKNYPTFREIYREVTEDFNMDNIIVGHSITNDFKMLYAAYRKNKIDPYEIRFLDSQIFYAIYKGEDKSIKLADCAKEFNIDLDEHNPKSDAKVSVLVIKSILEKEGLSLKEFMEKYEMSFGEVSNFFVKEINCNLFHDKKRYKINKCNKIYELVKNKKFDNYFSRKAVWFKSDLFAQFDMEGIVSKTLEKYRIVEDKRNANINVNYLKNQDKSGALKYSLIEYVKKVLGLKSILHVDEYTLRHRYGYAKGFNLENYIIKGMKPQGKIVQNEFTGKLITFSKSLMQSEDFIQDVYNFVIKIGARYTENIKQADVFVVADEKEMDEERDNKIKYLIRNNLLKEKIIITKDEYIHMQENIK